MCPLWIQVHTELTDPKLFIDSVCVCTHVYTYLLIKPYLYRLQRAQTEWCIKWKERQVCTKDIFINCNEQNNMVLFTFTNISTSCVTRLWIPTSFPWWVIPEEDPIGHSRKSLLQSICGSDSSTNQRRGAHHYPTTTDWCTEWHQGPTRFNYHPTHFCIHEFNLLSSGLLTGGEK